MNKKRFNSMQEPECTLTFKLSRELMGQIEFACKKLDITKSALCRRGASEFITLWVPEAIGEPVSVLERHQI
jgi:hypothetical protein